MIRKMLPKMAVDFDVYQSCDCSYTSAQSQALSRRRGRDRRTSFW